MYATGLLYGVSDDLTSDTGRLRDNNVFGFAMNYEYIGANFATYGGVGVGPVDHLVLRLGHRRSCA